ncbi:MAG: cytochrome P450 [Cytophagales bacterium]|nr:MAG: cytochrome P450 [Cytophagales bacterium]
MTAPETTVPVHPGWPIVGNTPAFARDPLGTFSRLAQQYDRVVKISLGGRDQYVAFRPEDVKHVFQENNRNYVRSPALRLLKVFLGEGLLTSDGDFWRRQRRLAQPAFHRQKLAILAQTMVTESADWMAELKHLDHTKPVNMSLALTDVTMRIVCKTLFGTDVSGTGQLEGLSWALDTSNYLANKLVLMPVRVPLSWPTPDNNKRRRASELVDTLIYGFIANRRQTGESRDDLLDMLLNAVDEETGAGMSDKQLRDECITLFSAGHETTAVSMAWTLHLLATHPEIQARVRAEALEHLGDDTTGTPTLEQFRSLTYTLQVVQESMRLYPPAWALSRMAVDDDQLGPYRIPAGKTVLVAPYLLHRDPRQWEDPNRFDPDRFAPGRDKERHPYAYMPFGGGPRLCIGNQFALMEMQILLGLFARTFAVRSVSGEGVEPQPLITLRPKKPVTLLLNLA